MKMFFNFNKSFTYTMNKRFLFYYLYRQYELSITKELYHKVSKMLSNEKANSVKLMTRIKV